MKVEEIVEVKKEIVENRIITYKTSDGTILKSRYKAECYQHELDIEYLKQRDDLEYTAEAFTPYGDYFSSEENEYIWYRAKTPEAIQAINETYFGLDVPQKRINEWICVESNSEDNDCYYYTLERSITGFTKLLEKLGYEIEIKEK